MEIEKVEKMIVTIRDCRVIIDRDVAALYGVETKRVNEAVKNNPEKFPDGYVFQLSRDESESLRSKFSTLKIATHLWTAERHIRPGTSPGCS